MKKKLSAGGIAAIVVAVALAAGIVWFSYILFAPTYPPYEDELCTDAADYMKVNSYVEEELLNRYVNFLPKEIAVKDDTKYIYHYSFSDQELHLMLYLEQSFDTEALFTAEVERIKSFRYSEEQDCGGIKYIVFKMPDAEKAQKYLADEKAWDFYFMAARADTEQRRVTYMLSIEYDNMDKCYETIEFLNTYLHETGQGAGNK